MRRPHQRQIVEAPHGGPFAGLLVAQQRDAHRRLEDLIAPLIGRAEHQRRHPVVRPDDGDPAEQHPRRRRQEASEDHPGRERQAAHTEQHLQADQQIGGEQLRVHLAIADRRHGLDAEKERIAKGTGPGVADAAAGEQIEHGEDDVEDKVGQRQQAVKEVEVAGRTTPQARNARPGSPEAGKLRA